MNVNTNNKGKPNNNGKFTTVKTGFQDEHQNFDLQTLILLIKTLKKISYYKVTSRSKRGTKLVEYNSEYVFRIFGFRNDQRNGINRIVMGP